MLKVYLISPYTKLDHDYAYRKALRAAKAMTEQGISCFSPIAYAHQMRDLNESSTFWRHFNTSWIDWCQVAVVLYMPGWNKSVGVSQEIKIAKEKGKELYFLNEESITIHTLTELKHIFKDLTEG